MTTRERLAIMDEIERRNRARREEFREQERKNRFRSSSTAAATLMNWLAKMALVFFCILTWGAVALLA